MKKYFNAVLLSSLCFSAFLTGCATSFTGSAHVEGGRTGCEAKCKGQGLEFVGMVYMGEYSDACMCATPEQVSAAGGRSQLMAAGAASATGSVGVILAMRERERQRNSRQMTMMSY